MTGLPGCAAEIAFAAACVRQVAVPRPLRWVLGVLAALAVLSASWTVSLFSGLPLVAIDAALLLAALALLAVKPAARPGDQPVSSKTQRWMALAFGAAAVIAGAGLVDHLVRFPDGGNDAFIIWNLRARWMFRAGTDFRSAFSPAILFWTHQDYPLLLPGLVVRGFALVGRESRAVPAVVACLFVGCVVSLVITGVPSRRRWWSGLAIVTTPALVMLGATEQADIPVAAFLAAASAILIARKRGDARALAAAGAFVSMAAWTKNEGMLHVLLFLAAVLLDERRLRAALAFLLGALPFLGLLAFFKFSYAPHNDLLQLPVIAALERALSIDRWWTLVLLLGRRIVLLQAWGLHLVALVLWLAFFRRPGSPPLHVKWLSLVPIATMIIHLSILLVQPHDLTFMFKVTIDRLLMQVWPTILLLLFAENPP